VSAGGPTSLADPPAGVPPRRWPRLGLTWLVWRQHRAALAATLALFAAAAALLLATGLPMHASYRDLGVAGCAPADSARCVTLTGTFAMGYDAWALYMPRLLEFLPGLVGMFIGAPLVAREFESGTFRFAWTQGRGRTRVLVVRLAWVCAVAGLAALGLSLLFGWWFAPYEPIQGRIAGGQAFEVEGLVFAARTLVAVALGALAGALIRRTVPAMAATLVGWLAVMYPTVVFWRQHYRAPVTGPVSSTGEFGTEWTLSQWWQAPDGRRLDDGTITAIARQAAAQGVRPPEWLRDHGYLQWETFQPNSRFWTFQVIETGWLCALALALAAGAVWWVRRAG
jgi:hypothetical protein